MVKATCVTNISISRQNECSDTMMVIQVVTYILRLQRGWWNSEHINVKLAMPVDLNKKSATQNNALSKYSLKLPYPLIQWYIELEFVYRQSITVVKRVIQVLAISSYVRIVKICLPFDLK